VRSYDGERIETFYVPSSALRKAQLVSTDDAPDAEFTDIMFYDYDALDRKILAARGAIQRRWVESDDPQPWSLAWSGGKDSTAALKLVVEAILDLPEEVRKKRPLRVVSSDTRMENPNIEVYLHDQSTKFNEWAKRIERESYDEMDGAS
jgi:3'-phosphoadenosine 5'-phosphosulfate sulfotransferase (PAPS reductase)/FAD synthetase